MSTANDFVIESGVLKEYVGPGGDVMIPDGVTTITIYPFTIHAPAGSYAETYAKENNIPFVAV